MKNIHVLPTDKPSILIKDIWKNTFSLVENFNTNHTDFKAQHIIITSDEEIKEGDWCISLCNDESYEEIYQCKDVSLVDEEDKKIILTTDQDLINNGVQAILHEFLKWFVKNPSCDEVVTNKLYEYSSRTHIGYEIIFPKEEPKPHVFCETPEEKCTMNYCDENGCQNRKRELVEPKQKPILLDEAGHWKFQDNQNDWKILSKEFLKQDRMTGKRTVNMYLEGIDPYAKQETLEEAIKMMCKELLLTPFEKPIFINGVKEGVKWHSDKVLDFLHEEITERREYSASKMCEKVIEFIEQLKKQ